MSFSLHLTQLKQNRIIRKSDGWESNLEEKHGFDREISEAGRVTDQTGRLAENAQILDKPGHCCCCGDLMAGAETGQEELGCQKRQYVHRCPGDI